MAKWDTYVSNNTSTRKRYDIFNRFLACDTCNRHDKLIRLYEFNEVYQEDAIHEKAIHLISKHGFKI